MLYYLIPYLFLAATVSMLYISKIKRKNYTVFLFCVSMPAIFIAVLSGDSGTDKEAYYTWIGNAFNGNMEKVTYEPGFKYLTYLLSFIYPHVYVIIPIIAFLTSCFLIRAYSNSKWQLLIFTFFIFPYFYYDMTMNGLRYGLSFSLASMAALQLTKDKKSSVKFFIYALLAVSMQYSSIIILALIYVSQMRIKKADILLLIVLGYAVFNMLDFTYFDNKADAYKDASSPSGLSGLSPLILFVVIFVFNWLLNKKLHFIFFVLLVLELASFMLSLKSYSGLRFQSLMIFTLMLFIANFQEPPAFRKRMLFAFFLIGIMSFSLKIRNFMSEEKYVNTPFLPYEFFWERK